MGHATCEKPKTCSVCSKTEGKALGHKWKEVTCEKPKTCKVCGKTEGDSLGHDWLDATYSEPMTCERCGKTKGDKLEAPDYAGIREESTPDNISICGMKITDNGNRNYSFKATRIFKNAPTQVFYCSGDINKYGGIPIENGECYEQIGDSENYIGSFNGDISLFRGSVLCWNYVLNNKPNQIMFSRWSN